MLKGARLACGGFWPLTLLFNIRANKIASGSQRRVLLYVMFSVSSTIMLEDLYKIQLYKIYYKNTNNILPSYFQTFTPHYYNALEHGHDLRHNVVRLPLTKREYYVQCTKYQFLKLIRDTSQSDLDRSLTSSLTQFIAYFKYSIIESYNPQCTVRNCFVCARQ